MAVFFMFIQECPAEYGSILLFSFFWQTIIHRNCFSAIPIFLLQDRIQPQYYGIFCCNFVKLLENP